MFRLKPEYRKEETVSQLTGLLRQLPEQVPTILTSEIGAKPLPMPTESPDGGVQFYDVVQILSFATPEDCAAYPATPGHQRLMAETSEWIAQVAGIDYPL
jgi:hypothetical protein